MKRLLHTINNNLYMLKLSYKACPIRVISEFVMGIIDNSFNIFYVAFFSRTIVNYVQAGFEFAGILNFLVFSSMAFLVNAIIRNIYNGSIRAVYDQVLIANYNILLLEKINELDILCYDDVDFYEKYKIALNEGNNRIFSIMSNISMFITSFLSCFALLWILYEIDIIFALIVFVPVLAKLIFGKKTKKLVYELELNNSELHRKKDYVKRVVCDREYSNELRIYNIYNLLKKNYIDSSNEVINNIKEKSGKIVLFSFLNDVLNTSATYLLAGLYAAYKVIITKTMMIGELAIISVTILNVSAVIVKMIEAYLGLFADSLYVDNFREFINYKPYIDEEKSGKMPDNELGDIVFQNVSFGYKEHEKKVLNNISFKIEPKEKIAIVGENGAGKTTLIKMILRLYDPDKGEIIYDNINLKKYDIRKYRKLFNVVFQDFKLFSMSVYDNIVLGEEKRINQNDVLNAIELAGLSENIKENEKGLDAVLYKEFDDDGIILSGGQMQKLALARIFVSGKKMVLIDEPTSALDAISEYELLKNIFRFCEDKTLVFVSHNIFSAKLADRIIVLSNGKVVESGTHDELMNIKGEYYRMHNEQSTRYEE